MEYLLSTYYVLRDPSDSEHRSWWDVKMTGSLNEETGHWHQRENIKAKSKALKLRTDENIKHYLQTRPHTHTHTHMHTHAHTLQPAHTQARGIFPDHIGGYEPFLLMLPSMDCRLLKKSHSPTSSWATDHSQHLEAVVGPQLPPSPSTHTGSPSAAIQAFQHGESPACDTHPGQLRL